MNVFRSPVFECKEPAQSKDTGSAKAKLIFTKAFYVSTDPITKGKNIRSL